MSIRHRLSRRPAQRRLLEAHQLREKRRDRPHAALGRIPSLVDSELLLSGEAWR
jgi:hypothetical protein